MLKRIISRIIVFILMVGCSNNERTILVDAETIAVGNISRDTIYDGLVRFYDAKTNRLITTANYSRGIQNGESIGYSSDGKIVSKANYADGKQNGLAYFYDKTGKPELQYYSYYGLKVGESVRYKNGKPSTYKFYSFDNKLLFSIDYDSIGLKKVTDVQEAFFFFTIRPFSPNAKLAVRRSELFVYTPNPPEYQFNYSLVLINDQFDVKKEIRFFSIGQPWSICELPLEVDAGTKLALRLQIVDPNSQRNMALFKVVE